MAPKTLVSPAQCPNRPRELPAVEVRDRFVEQFTAFPDFQFVPSRSYHATDTAVVEGRIVGTYLGDWTGIAGTGNRVDACPDPRHLSRGPRFQPTFPVAGAAWSPERMAWRSETVNDRRKRSVRSETDRSPRVRGASDRRVAGPVPNRPRLRGERGRGRGQLAPGGLRDGISGRPGHSAD